MPSGALLVTGQVPDETARRIIGDIAAEIEGIDRVHNELVIAPVSTAASRADDVLISSSFKARVLASRRLSTNHVKPLTESGVLFLMGLVNLHESREAVDIARTTAGVREVVNLMEIVPEAQTRRIDHLRSDSAGARPLDTAATQAP